jgi:tetratricopeptide (TPR) repeat protein
MRCLVGLSTIFLCWSLSSTASGQRPTSPVNPLGQAPIAGGLDSALTLFVSVRGRTGIPLEIGAVVKVTSALGGQSVLATTMDAATASFPNMRSGEYEIEVEATGYQTAHERVSVNGVSSYTAYVYLTTVEASSKNAQPSSTTVMTPDLQREMDQGLQALKRRKYDEARKHLEKAAKKAPSNPDIQYLLGLIDYNQQNILSARKHFEAVISLFPAHEKCLLLLARIQMEAGENRSAVSSLQSALQTNSANWQSHLMIAYAYAQLGEYEKASTGAQRAAELNKDKIPATEVLRGKLFLMKQQPGEAKKLFDDVVSRFPSDEAAKEAKSYLARLESVERKSPEKTTINLPPAAPPIPERPWAPPDIDSIVPSVVGDVTCALSDVQSRTTARLKLELEDFERFGATEHIEHQEIDTYGVPSPSKSRDFRYIVFVQRPTKDFFYIDERRDGEESIRSFPSNLATRGLVSIGVNLFHPIFSSDFTFVCEGLGQWRGRPAWQLRFEQKKEVPSRIRAWEARGKIYTVALKGRVWVAANTFDLLHIETELREPLQDLELKREHLIIDYGPVKFSETATELWLPWFAEMYFDLRGKRYHHKHTLTEYVLFNVDSKSTISKPKDVEEKQQPPS